MSVLQKNLTLQRSTRPSTGERKIYDRSRKNDEVDSTNTPRNDDRGKYNENTDEYQSTTSGGEKIYTRAHTATGNPKQGERR